MKKTIWGIVILLIIILAVVSLRSGNDKQISTEEIKIGVIASLTGKGAVRGESVIQGIDLALDELNQNITIIYQDVALDQAKITIEQSFSPDAYNIGINDGSAAGQTVPHLHLHLIARYKWDVADPRGGIRWLFAGKAHYWSTIE